MSQDNEDVFGCHYCRETFNTNVEREKHMMSSHAAKYFGGSDYIHVHA